MLLHRGYLQSKGIGLYLIASNNQRYACEYVYGLPCEYYPLSNEAFAEKKTIDLMDDLQQDLKYFASDPGDYAKPQVYEVKFGKMLVSSKDFLFLSSNS